ncbi:MAG TPA: DUF4179 domain-containing protein [Salinimicrobium sp.]|nr:DUF4179 domain-containing protein [Salinimicrobium sp.]
MKTDNLEELFQGLDFDVTEPKDGHQQRFEEKLKGSSKKNTRSSGIIPLWLPWMAVAACFLIAVVLFGNTLNPSLDAQGELASVSPEMAETQDFYASVINKELYRLEQEKTPETEAIVQDALKQLEILENDYNKLKTDLVKSGQDQRVIYAMISNFQKRIDLLNQVLEKVNTINTLKISPHENNLL